MTTTTQSESTQEGWRWFAGTLLRIVTDTDVTGGQLAVMEQHARQGFSPPRHVHRREDTAMFVVDGRLTVVIGDEEQVVESGGFVWLPRDVPHTFRVDSEEAHVLELITPAGVEQFHVDASDPAPITEIPPPAEPDIARLVAAADGYRVEIIGPPLLAPA
ncbi:MAG: cupin domain-containing protein [Ilumatobacteraceae bacterium]